MSWARAFDDPIELPDGRALRTLRDAGHYVTALSKADQSRSLRREAAKRRSNKSLTSVALLSTPTHAFF
jgi:hypothetical protein